MYYHKKNQTIFHVLSYNHEWFLLRTNTVKFNEVVVLQFSVDSHKNNHKQCSLHNISEYSTYAAPNYYQTQIILLLQTFGILSEQ